jgi:hypothetical protein
MSTATAKPAQRLAASVDDNRLPPNDRRRALGLHATGTVVWRDEAWYCDQIEVFSLYDAGRDPMEKDVEFLRSELERIAAENCPMADVE